MLETYQQAKASGELGSLRLRLQARFACRLKVEGADRLPRQGGALLVSNQISLADPLLVARAVRRAVGSRGLSRLVFLNCAEGGDSQQDFERARQLLQEGYVVCLFAEAAIPRRGTLLRFNPALERVVRGLDVPVIPVAIDRRWGSLFHREGESVRWQWPRRFPYPVTVCFGTPLESSTSAFRTRLAVQELQARLFDERKYPGETLPAKFIYTARRFPLRLAMTDHTGKRLRFFQALAGALSLRHLFKSRLGGEERVGVLLPPSNTGALVNLALSMLGKVAVNLNYTISGEALESCRRKAEIRTVITARAFLKKLRWPEHEYLLPLEEISRELSRFSRLRAALAATLLPAWLLKRRYCVPTDPDSPATVLFSSGSTGDPKGIVLSHFNILSNIQGATQFFNFGREDRVVGVLPFFHAFGYTATLWLPMLAGQAVLYHPNPREGKAVGRLVRRDAGTILVCPPTFFQIYVRQCQAEDFRTLRYAIAGAEKLQPALARAFEERFGLPLLEGYGATELAPIVSLNILKSEEESDLEVGYKAGTIGHPLPGIAVKVVDLETGEDLDAGEEGIICVKGPNVMLGYLDDPKRTAEVMRDGWYETGDVGRIDEDGFIEITDRLSRFSKVGGEMVPHLKVEGELQEIAPEVRFAVSAIADERKGERLVVLHTPLPGGLSVDSLVTGLRDRKLPNLFIPRSDSFIEVENIPVLATGKVDLRTISDIAAKKLSKTS